MGEGGRGSVGRGLGEGAREMVVVGPRLSAQSAAVEVWAREAGQDWAAEATPQVEVARERVVEGKDVAGEVMALAAAAEGAVRAPSAQSPAEVGGSAGMGAAARGLAEAGTEATAGEKGAAGTAPGAASPVPGAGARRTSRPWSGRSESGSWATACLRGPTPQQTRCTAGKAVEGRLAQHAGQGEAIRGLCAHWHGNLQVRHLHPPVQGSTCTRVPRAAGGRILAARWVPCAPLSASNPIGTLTMVLLMRPVTNTEGLGVSTVTQQLEGQAQPV